MFNKPGNSRQYNLTKKESEALKWLLDRDDIIIKSADKGGAVCVWGKDKYTTEAVCQLRDTQYYSMPLKVHRNLENPPDRPIISENDSIPEPCSKYVDYYIKAFVAKLPSYIQDSTQVLYKIAQLKNIGSCIMATMEVESLSSNIVHEERL